MQGWGLFISGSSGLMGGWGVNSGVLEQVPVSPILERSRDLLGVSASLGNLLHPSNIIYSHCGVQ